MLYWHCIELHKLKEASHLILFSAKEALLGAYINTSGVICNNFVFHSVGQCNTFCANVAHWTANVTLFVSMLHFLGPFQLFFCQYNQFRVKCNTCLGKCKNFHWKCYNLWSQFIIVTHYRSNLTHFKAIMELLGLL